MSKIVSIHSFRGGTGKSNLSANLTCQLAARGKRVAVIDTDIQSPGIHVIFQLPPADMTYSLNDYLHNRCAIEQAATDVTRVLGASRGPVTPGGAIYLIPSSIQTGEIARILNEGYDVGLLNDGIRQVIERLNLDYLFIDTHPGVNEETLLSIAISDVLFLVMRPDKQDFQGTGVTVELARQLEVNNMYLVLNMVLNIMDPDALRAKAEDAFKTQVGEVLPLSEDLVQLGSGGVFSLLNPEHPYSRRIANLADIVAASPSPVARGVNL
jgi:MinD-like ATPase involved in chromosome partitioning or flagellar assembly